jgi:serine/threonine protein phosphatase 1
MVFEKYGTGTFRSAPQRKRFVATTWPAAIYAIGDIHGCLQQLIALEARIFADAQGIDGEKWLICLGDYVDRGPDSAGVIDHVMAEPPPGFRRICLAGNHETMALAFLSAPQPGSSWLGFGGRETLLSYGISEPALRAADATGLRELVRSHVPASHIRFMEELYLLASVPGHVFVHAGLRPGIVLDQQAENDLLWIRDEFFLGPPHPGIRVIHGHTPAANPVFADGRIGIDTGAFATGILTALRIVPDGGTMILDTADQFTPPR